MIHFSLIKNIFRVRKYREEAKNGGTPVLYLNAGDTYTGTAWFTVFKDNITSAFLNKLEPDAIVRNSIMWRNIGTYLIAW